MINRCDLRSRSRVRLNLPVRIRQALGREELNEVTRTLDVSRHGFAFRTRVRFSMLGTLWVALPYSTDAVFNPEFPAAPVRIEYSEDGTARVAVRFHSAQVENYRRVRRAAQSDEARQDRRGVRRAQVVVPVRVRHLSQNEESVTLDISAGGLLFRAQQPYVVNQLVSVAAPYQPGETASEVNARVARITDVDGFRAVGLQFIRRA